MEQEDLIKKLEKTSFPEIELPSHRRNLRMVLMDKYSKEKRNWKIFSIFRILAPLGGAVVILIVLVSNNLIFPTYTSAKAKEIALRDPQFKELVEQGAIIGDIEIIKDKAYILVQSQPSKAVVEAPTPGVGLKLEEGSQTSEESVGVLVEVDFKEKKVSKLEKFTSEIISLTEQEKEKAKEIANNNPEVQKIIPKEAEILKINPLPLPMRLVKSDDSVQIIPESNAKKKVIIIYQLGKKQWQGKINLSKEEAEEINFLGEIEE